MFCVPNENFYGNPEKPSWMNIVNDAVLCHSLTEDRLKISRSSFLIYVIKAETFKRWKRHKKEKKGLSCSAGRVIVSSPFR